MTVQEEFNQFKAGITVNEITQINKISRPTAVEYLIEVLRVNAGIKVSKHLQEEVSQIEKQMTIDAYLAGYSATENQGDSEQYYNETYKKLEKSC